MIDNAAARSRGAVAAGFVGAALAIGAVITLGLTVGGGAGEPAPYRHRVRALPFPPRPEVAARFADPLAVADLLRQARAGTSAQLARADPGVAAGVPAVGLASLTPTTATALAFVDLGPDAAQYTIRLRRADNRWSVVGLTRNGAVRGPAPGSAGLADAVDVARQAAVLVLTGAPAPGLATVAFRPGLAGVTAVVGGAGTVRIDASGVAAATGDSATVLVAATRDDIAYRLLVTAARVGYTWRVGDLRLVS